MKKLKPIIVLVIVLAGAISWYLFRPELLLVNKVVNETPPTNPTNRQSPTQIKHGNFISGAHETVGSAHILRVQEGKQFLRLENFSTSNGPDVHVYLVATQDGAHVDLGSQSQVELGKLKGNKGNQNYEISKDWSIDGPMSVVIWCKRFSVNFGHANLK